MNSAQSLRDEICYWNRAAQSTQPRAPCSFHTHTYTRNVSEECGAPLSAEAPVAALVAKRPTALQQPGATRTARRARQGAQARTGRRFDAAFAMRQMRCTSHNMVAVAAGCTVLLLLLIALRTVPNLSSSDSNPAFRPRSGDEASGTVCNDYVLGMGKAGVKGGEAVSAAGHLPRQLGGRVSSVAAASRACSPEPPAAGSLGPCVCTVHCFFGSQWATVAPALSIPIRRR